MKIGSMGEDVATMGMGDPESEDGELIAGADEILAEELSQIVEGLNRVDAGDIVFRSKLVRRLGPEASQRPAGGRAQPRGPPPHSAQHRRPGAVPHRLRPPGGRIQASG